MRLEPRHVAFIRTFQPTHDEENVHKPDFAEQAWIKNINGRVIVVF